MNKDQIDLSNETVFIKLYFKSLFTFEYFSSVCFYIFVYYMSAGAIHPVI